MLWMSRKEDLFRFGTEGIRGRLNYGDRGRDCFSQVTGSREGPLVQWNGREHFPGRFGLAGEMLSTWGPALGCGA